MPTNYHPVANWLSVNLDVFRHYFEQLISDMNEGYKADPNASGLPLASHEWFWSEQLPQLAHDPGICNQLHNRLAELSAKRIAIEDQIRLQAVVLIEEQSEIDAEMALLQQVLQ